MSKNPCPVIVWFRQDLRLADNPALYYAAQTGKPILPVFIYNPKARTQEWHPGAASRWWLHHSLKALQKNLAKHNMNLRIMTGDPCEVMLDLAKEVKADHVVWNRRYAPDDVEIDKRIKSDLIDQTVEVKTFKANVLFEPWEIKTKTGNHFYKVYTPFMKACRAQAETIRPPYDEPKMTVYDRSPQGSELNDLKLLPDIGWDKKFYDIWTPGEEGAWNRLDEFLDDQITDYKEGRNYPDEEQECVSRLSAHLHWGEISPYQIWYAVNDFVNAHQDISYKNGPRTFLDEILWREFSYHLLFNIPDFPNKPMREKFADFKWSHSEKNLKAWQKGCTGYPIVDAAMRQLWQTGWMHNRLRMIVGSFLVKDLHINWREGEKWFWDTLVDADLANNTMGWQWVAGCGPDAAPFFRIFNPVTQSEKYDAKGRFIRQYVPELSDMPDKYIHAPWMAPEKIRKDYDYPDPIVNHKEMRELALEKYHKIK